MEYYTTSPFGRSYRYVIDYLKVSIKIQDPTGNYIPHEMVMGLTQYYIAAGGSQDRNMLVLYDLTWNVVSSVLPFPLNTILKTAKSAIPNPLLNKYEHGGSDTTHWWKFDYGALQGEDELGLLIIFSPTLPSISGYYIVTMSYDVHIKELGHRGGVFINPMYEKSWWTYSTSQSIIAIKN